MSKQPLSSSTGTKYVIAISGLGLVAFLVLHLAGNLLFFAGEEVFNGYSHALMGGPLKPLILAIEFALLAVFLLHIFKAAGNYRKNQTARPVSYAKKEMAGGKSRKSWASSTMIFTGISIIAFVILHLWQFRFGPHYLVPGTNERDLYRLQIEVFSNPLWVALYSFFMLWIGFHLWHGFWSAFQSFGLGSERATPQLVNAAKGVSLAVSPGFGFIPIAVYMGPARTYKPPVGAPHAPTVPRRDEGQAPAAPQAPAGEHAPVEGVH